MDLQDTWEKALKQTEVIRPRLQPLHTFSETHLPYIFLAESAVNRGDTVVRKGEVLMEKPSLVLPPDTPQFEGFDFEKEYHLNQDLLTNFLLLRGIRFPSFKYENKVSSLEVFSGRLSLAIRSHLEALQREENVAAGLLTGPEDSWQFSVLIFICTQAVRSADRDIQRILEKFKKGGKD